MRRERCTTDYGRAPPPLPPQSTLTVRGAKHWSLSAVSSVCSQGIKNNIFPYNRLGILLGTFSQLSY